MTSSNGKYDYDLHRAILAARWGVGDYVSLESLGTGIHDGLIGFVYTATGSLNDVEPVNPNPAPAPSGLDYAFSDFIKVFSLAMTFACVMITFAALAGQFNYGGRIEKGFFSGCFGFIGIILCLIARLTIDGAFSDPTPMQGPKGWAPG